MTDTIHSCGYHCQIPGCIKAQRDELVAKYVAQPVKPCTGCNGHGEVGGLRSDGYHSDICPYCKGGGTEQITQSVQPVQPVADEKLLEIARATGLRSHLQGVNATDAKLLLRQYVEAVRAAIAQPVAPAELVHLDDLAVDRFAGRMKWKLRQKREEGKSGWQDRSWTPEQISQALRDHVEKGDPTDVANYCMFLAARGEPIAPDIPSTAQPVKPAYCEWLEESSYRAGAMAGFQLGIFENDKGLANLLDAHRYPKPETPLPVKPAAVTTLTKSINYREIADCVISNLDGRKGVLCLDVDAETEEEIRQEAADTIENMAATAQPAAPPVAQAEPLSDEHKRMMFEKARSNRETEHESYLQGIEDGETAHGIVVTNKGGAA